MLPRVESLSSTSWVSLTVAAILLMLITVFVINKHRYLLQLRNLVNSRERVMTYDVEQNSVLADILLWVVVIMSYALLSFSFLIFFSGQSGVSLSHYLWLIVGTAAFFGIKWLLFKALGAVFGMRDKSSYTQSYFIVVAVFGIISLVMATAVIYTAGILHLLWWLYFAFVVSAFIFVLFKAIQIFYRRKGSLFYIFLYLCTLEIMPAMLALKVALIV